MLSCNLILRRWRLVVFCLPLLLSACSQPDKSAAQVGGPMPVKVTSLDYTKVTEWDEFTGRFEASKRVEVKARVSGFVESIAYQDGQMVEKDQPLYQLDKRPFEIELASAKAQLSLANKEYRRGLDLAAKKSISEEQLDERLQQLQAAQVNIERASLNREFATVTAPISGRIDRTYIDAGNLITGGNVSADTLTTIVAINPIFFYFSGSESQVLEYIRRGIAHPEQNAKVRQWPVSVKLQDEETYQHHGIFNFSSNSLDVDTGTTEARAIFDNKDRLIQPGMFGRLRISPVPEYNAIAINDEWIMSERDRKFVYVVGAENKAEKRYVEISFLTDDRHRVIKSGLTDQDTLIIGGLQMLRPGMPIKPTPANALSAGE